jgi:ubiquinone/menaquinone biosynthesis C-methylase UbiE
MIGKSYKIKAGKTSHWLKRASPTPEHITLINKYMKVKNPVTLDVGCAEGENTSIFAQSGFKAVGIDYNKSFLDLATEKYPSIKFEFGDVEKMKYKTGAFDLVYCINTLFYTNLDKSIPEILRVVKANGFAFITFDTKIIDLDKEVIIHRASLDTLKNLVGEGATIVYMKSRQRTDKTPFKHRHVYYDILIKKV